MKDNTSTEQHVEHQTPVPANPCTLVIFGAGGDLAQRKLYPALYNLLREKLLPQSFAVVGFARKEMDTETYRKNVLEDLKTELGKDKSFDQELAEHLSKRFNYFQGDSTKAESFSGLKTFLDKVDDEFKTGKNFLFYLATPPQLFSVIPQQLHEVGLLEEGEFWRRLIIEKPFGNDYDSAVKLNNDLRKVMKENQIYRIDHYLGKETVQNLMVFRFGNGIFEPIWNRRYIDSVQISVCETLGVEERGGYYDGAGALRDMVPNHLFQLMAMTAMEPPNSFEADEVREEKVKLLKAIKPFTKEMVRNQVVRGQYGGGEVGGKTLPAYRAESNVAKDSATETFTALRLDIDNWRWAGVPFYLRTGKRLAKRLTEIVVQFRSVPFQIFRDTNVDKISPNQLIMKIQPEEGISLRFASKIPGPDIHIQDVGMDFNYEDYFGNRPNTGYETLLYDCMNGDPTLFQRADQTEIGWKVIDPILKLWAAEPPTDFPNYKSGSWGPEGSQTLLKKSSCRWRNETT